MRANRSGIKTRTRLASARVYGMEKEMYREGRLSNVYRQPDRVMGRREFRERLMEDLKIGYGYDAGLDAGGEYTAADSSDGFCL